MSKTNYADSKKSTLAILEILKRETSENKTLTIQEIMKLVKVCYDIEISRNTVTATLHSLSDFYGDDVICCTRIERGNSDYTTSYFYNDSENCSDLKKKVKLIRAAISEDVKLEKGGKYDTENWITFNLYGYGADGNLGFIKQHTIYPLEVIEKGEQSYIVGTYENAKNDKVYHFRVELMNEIVTNRINAKFDKSKRKRLRASLSDICDYSQKHTNMYSGDVIPFTLVAKYNGNKGNGLTYLHDIFGKWMLIKSDEESATVVVNSTDAIMDILLKQYEELIYLVD